MWHYSTGQPPQSYQTSVIALLVTLNLTLTHVDELSLSALLPTADLECTDVAELYPD